MKEMTATANQRNPSSSTSRIAIPFRRYLGGRRGLILLAVALLAVGAFLKWDWLVAAGIAPLLLAFAPCAAMCALGLCMSKMGGKSCSTESKAGNESKASNESVETTARAQDGAEAIPPPTMASARTNEGS